MNTQTLKVAALAATLAAFTSGCATYTGQTNDPNDPNRTRNGALIGAAIGAAAGLLSGGNAVERRQRAMVDFDCGTSAGRYIMSSGRPPIRVGSLDAPMIATRVGANSAPRVMLGSYSRFGG